MRPARKRLTTAGGAITLSTDPQRRKTSLMGQQILTELDAGVLEIRITRPEKKNALTAAMYAVLAETLDGAADDPAIRAVLLTGSGDAFTAGNDLADFLEHPPRGTDSPVFRFLEAISTSPQPLVAAVNGLAIGIGTTLLLHCDLVYAAHGARFQLPFVNLGLVPEAAVSLLLPRVAGHARAAELLLLGEPFSAERADEIGLLTARVDAADLLPTARAAARKLAAKPRGALRATKALMRRGEEPVAARMQAEVAEFASRLVSPAAREAFSAFLDKRQPDFTGLD